MRSTFLCRRLLLTTALLLAGCTSKGTNRGVEPAEAFGMLQNRFAQILDVREADEVRGGVAAGALWMPMSKIESDSTEWREFQKNTLKKDKTIIIYCGSGGRAGEAASLLNKAGFDTGTMGAYSGWVAAGLPQDPAPTP